MLAPARLRLALENVPADGLTGPFHRYVWFRHVYDAPFAIPSMLSGEFSRRAGGRYTPRGSFRTIYLAADPITALREIEARFANAPAPPEVHCTVVGQLAALLNLVDGSVRKALHIEIEELFAPWEALDAIGIESPTQAIGRAVYESRLFEGVIFPLAQVSEGVNIAVFPDRPYRSSWLEVMILTACSVNA